MSTQYGQLTVNVRQRTGKGVARKLRAGGDIPGVIYGRGTAAQGENVLLAFSPLELRRALDPQRRLNTFFQLTLKQDGKPDQVEACVIADAQMDPIRDEFLHVDFLRVDPEQPVTVQIPVEYSGRAVGVAAGGKLKTFRRFVRIAAKPAEIPVSMPVDVTPLNTGEGIRLQDLPLTNARLVDNPETVVAFVEVPGAAIEETPADEGEKKEEPAGD